MAAPTLETARLRLRPHRADDYPELLAMWSDPRVVRYIGGRPFESDEVWTRLLRYAGMWSLLDYGFWAILDRASGAYLGDAGFMDAHRRLDPPFEAPETGWALRPEAQGRGVAGEALEAVLDWGDARGFARTVCMIGTENAASLRVAEKLGYAEYAKADFAGSAMQLFERFNPRQPTPPAKPERSSRP